MQGKLLYYQHIDQTNVDDNRKAQFDLIPTVCSTYACYDLIELVARHAIFYGVSM